jgi:beta-lactamase regulating signal transducer with metallopeptidase domain
MSEMLVQLVLIVTAILVTGILSSALLSPRPARAHFALAMLLAATLVAPVCWLAFGAVGLGLIQAEQVASASMSQSPAETLQRKIPSDSAAALPQVVNPDSSFLIAPQNSTSAEISSDVATGRPVAPSEDAGLAAVGGPDAAGADLSSVFVVCWLILSSLMLMLTVRSLVITRRLVRSAVEVESDTLMKSFHEVVEEMQVSRTPCLAHSPRISCPVVCCWASPKVIVPTQMLSDAEDAADWTGIFRHELAHLRRRDHLATLLAETVRILIPWHPLSHLAARRLHAFAERACDDWVSDFAATDGDNERYAETLLSFQVQRLGFGIQASVRSRSQLAARIRRIISPTRSNPRVGNAWGAMLCMLVLTTIVGTGLAQERKPSPQAGRVATTVENATGDEAAATSRDLEPVPLSRTEAPRLIAVWPADKSQNVDPETELHLRFDRPIDPRSFDLQWIEGSYIELKPTRYLVDKHELVIPVRLVPGRQHRIAINQDLGLGHSIQRVKGFMTRDGDVVEAEDWQFTTRATPEPRDVERPRVVSIHPPERSTIARASLVRVRFDQPMDPSEFDAIRGSPIDETRIDIGIPYYTSENREFVIPIVLPPNWSGNIELSGMKSTHGVAVEPITVNYSTTGEIFDETSLEQFSDPESSATLRTVLENVRRARDDLQSFSATVRTTRLWGGRRSRGQGFERLDRHWTQFKMQGEEQFYGDVTQVMGLPFRIGSDGKQCWFFSNRDDDQGRRRPTLITCDPTQIANKILAFVDPFDLRNAETDQVIDDRNLQYIGLDKIDDRDCHLIRSWSASKFGGDDILLSGVHWWIDAETHLPIQVMSDFFGSRTENRYEYNSLNQAMPLAEFQQSVSDDVVRRGPDPLGDGYDSRYLKIGDGTNGRMSCRWGKTGAKGTSSAGLN